MENPHTEPNQEKPEAAVLIPDRVDFRSTTWMFPEIKKYVSERCRGQFKTTS